MDAFLIRGCGITIICNNEQDVKDWIQEILRKGGVPVVERIKVDE